MKRYRVKAGHKDWNEAGPDLLRTRPNSVRQVRSMLGLQTAGWHVRTETVDGWRDWRGPLTKHESVGLFDDWSPNRDGLAFQFGRNPDKGMDVLVAVRYEAVKDKDVGLNAGAEAIWSLVSHQFPGIRWAGGYVCKEYNGVPGAGWSDHAWKDACDATENPATGVRNDAVTGWSMRMARSGNMDLDYLLGSQGGKAGGAFAPDFDWRPGAASSHEWHNHYSFRDHDGRDPDCR